MIQREPQCVEHSVTFYQYPDENSIKLNTVPPCSLQTVPPGWRRWSSLSPRWVCPVTSKSRRQDHCSLQHFVPSWNFAVWVSYCFWLRLGISLASREREGDVEEVTLPNLGLGLVQNSWCRQVVTWSDVRHRLLPFHLPSTGWPSETLAHYCRTLKRHCLGKIGFK